MSTQVISVWLAERALAKVGQVVVPKAATHFQVEHVFGCLCLLVQFAFWNSMLVRHVANASPRRIHHILLPIVARARYYFYLIVLFPSLALYPQSWIISTNNKWYLPIPLSNTQFRFISRFNVHLHCVAPRSMPFACISWLNSTLTGLDKRFLN